MPTRPFVYSMILVCRTFNSGNNWNSRWFDLEALAVNNIVFHFGSVRLKKQKNSDWLFQIFSIYLYHCFYTAFNRLKHAMCFYSASIKIKTMNSIWIRFLIVVLCYILIKLLLNADCRCICFSFSECKSMTFCIVKIYIILFFLVF